MAMGKFKEALKDYENVAKHKSDPDLKKRLSECRKVYTNPTKNLEI